MRAGHAVGTWIGFIVPRSHGYLPTQCNETCFVAGELAVVSVSQELITMPASVRVENSEQLWA